MIRRNIFRSFSVVAVLALLAFTLPAFAQTATTGIRGDVADPSGAVIPGATVTVTTPTGKTVATTTSSATGTYSVTGIAPGVYNVDITEQGFAPFHGEAVRVVAGRFSKLDATLAIAVQQQQVHVQAESQSVGISPTANISAIDIKGAALNALSDDPDQLQNELEALAGPAAGPNGAQIYIDGFSGGQLPPKSDIREIRINSNPFSAEYDRLGYGRIEIFTKPGTSQWHGGYHVSGNYSAFNSQNPLLNANLMPGQTSALQEPSYYSYRMFGNLSGPIFHKASTFNLDVFNRHNESQAIIDALNPVPNSAGAYTTLNETFATPSTGLYVSPRADFQAGPNNTITLRYAMWHGSNKNQGVGGTILPEQATNSTSTENTVQASDSLIINKNLVDDIRLQFRHDHSEATSASSLPSVSLSGQFTTGGSTSQTSHSDSNNIELQNYFTGSYGAHSLTFGARLRTYDQSDYTDSGSNGSYMFTSLANYEAGKPAQYNYTKINNGTASAFMYDLALFYQDDWKVNPRFEFSYGVRWATQNHISNHSDWAPRVSLAYALDGGHGKKAKTVLRAGYGWFYNYFPIGNVIQTIHQNFSATDTPNEEQFTVTNPSFYNPNQTTVINSASQYPGSNTSEPTYYNIDPHFSLPNDMEGAIGIDRQISKNLTSNVTYIYTQGVHQFITNNIGAIANENVNPVTNTYTGVATPPTQNIYQYQSDGNYKEHQIMATLHAYYKNMTLFTYYSYSDAKSDTNGTPTVPSKPSLDYGRANFDVHDRFFALATIQAPWQLTFAPMFFASSGSPFNITTGTDLTGNNAYNSRPTYAANCSQSYTVQTKYGCFDTNPIGTNERIIPYNLGTGPWNYGINMRVSKVIGFGPKVKGGENGGPHGHGRGRGLGGRGLSGNSGPIGRFNSTVPRKYTLTLAAFGNNLLNHENLAVPNGNINLTEPSTNNPDVCDGSNYLTTTSTGGEACAQSFFLKSQSLAGGFFSRASSGNRTIMFEASVNF